MSSAESETIPCMHIGYQQPSRMQRLICQALSYCGTFTNSDASLDYVAAERSGQMKLKFVESEHNFAPNRMHCSIASGVASPVHLLLPVFTLIMCPCMADYLMSWAIPSFALTRFLLSTNICRVLTHRWLT